MTISYDGRSRVARNVVELIRSLDVFHISEPPKGNRTSLGNDKYREEAKDTDEEREWTAAEEREAFLCTSRMNAARWMADNKI